MDVLDIVSSGVLNFPVQLRATLNSQRTLLLKAYLREYWELTDTHFNSEAGIRAFKIHEEYVRSSEENLTQYDKMKRAFADCFGDEVAHDIVMETRFFHRTAFMLANLLTDEIS